MLYLSEMEGGASDEGRYPSNREIACAVCSVPPTSPISVASTTTKATGMTTAAVLTSSVAIKAAFAANKVATVQNGWELRCGAFSSNICYAPQIRVPFGTSCHYASNGGGVPGWMTL